MAAEIDNPEGKRRKKLSHRPKLLVDERVEVRSVEEGYEGSWHSGTVIACENRVRRIKFDHTFCGSRHSIQRIKIPSILDGIIPASRDLCNYRGLIRPTPPLFDFEKCSLQYGLCVDVYYDEAWWEGVIFDKEDGSEVRTVFFPDIGDEMQIEMNKFRITHDWDEFTEEWKRRGDWLFLELVKEVEQHYPLQVSLRQIWYEVRGKKAFEKLEQWTSTNRAIWKELVWDVIVDNCHISVHHFFQELELSGDFVQEALPPASNVNLDDILRLEAGSCPPLSNATVPPVAEAINLDGFTPMKEDGRKDSNFSSNLDMPCNEETPSKQDEVCELYSNSESKSFSSPRSITPGGKFENQGTRKRSRVWGPAGPDMVPTAECCPNSVTEYRSHKRADPLKLRMHLAYLGWKIEFLRENSISRFRYTSPDGKLYLSLHKVCEALMGPALDIVPLSCPDNTNISAASSEQQLASPLSNSKSIRFFRSRSITPGGKFEHHRTKKSVYVWRPAGPDMVPKAENCPNSVNEYCSHKRVDPLKLRMHLAYLGWKIEFVKDDSIIRFRYTSPNGKLYYSLVKVCEVLIDPALDIVPFSSQDNKILSAVSPERQFSSPISGQPHARQNLSSSDIVVESEYCPQAIVDYLGTKDNYLNSEVKVLRLRAKMHLSAIGWSMWYFSKSGETGRELRRELRYSSPRGRSYNSLRAACKGCIMEGGLNSSNAFESRPSSTEETRCLFTRERLSSKLSDVESGEDCLEEPGSVSLSREVSEICEPPVKGSKKLRRKRMNGLLPLLQRRSRNSYNQIVKKRKTNRSLIKLRDGLGNAFPVRVLRSSKRARQEMASSSSCQNAQTILSWLIDNNVVLPRAKVHYGSIENNHAKKQGTITPKGIRCICCRNVFTLRKFETHAGSTSHRSAANIFLEDGRSLLDCQMELKNRNSKKRKMMEPHEMKGRPHHGTNDYICTVCHTGGDLILCDQCPSSFHSSCLGLKGVPDGDWFCPSCCCQRCGKVRLDNITDVTFLRCHQCEHKYHVGCLKERGIAIADKHSNFWFCSKGCKKISLGLHKLLRKPISVGGDNVTWTLLKYMKCNVDDHDGYGMEVLTEDYSKLNVALSVMHECFEPLKEPGTRRDLVEDVIFCRGSDLNRLNFQGFYTVLLEKDDELISAATIRVHGKRVAEVPLVATRFKYRRLGMCRILMEELEKKLLELGVERLVLPAVPNVLNTWTTSFGFSQMTSMERLKFLDYTFLDFEGTVMCEKLLRKIPSKDLRPIIRPPQNIHGVVTGSDGINLDGNSAISEAFQADKAEKSEIVDQEASDVAGDGGSDGGSITAPPGFELNQPNLELVPCQNGYKERENSVFKFYRRRRISDCKS